jgi:hypothetical protein
LTKSPGSRISASVSEEDIVALLLLFLFTILSLGLSSSLSSSLFSPNLPVSYS